MLSDVEPQTPQDSTLTVLVSPRRRGHFWRVARPNRSIKSAVAHASSQHLVVGVGLALVCSPKLVAVCSRRCSRGRDACIGGPLP
jgi:hypothetical protein